MKILIASDIHGSEMRARQIHDLWKNENIDKVILLGDLLYHGPRNDLPQFYNPKKVIPLLSEMKDDIIAIRGNCDAEVDQMVLPFSIMEEKKELELNNRKVLLIHGHHAIPETDASIVFSGHTHIPRLEEEDNVIYFNPGSTTIPKDENGPCYGIWEDESLMIINLDNNKIIKMRKL